MCDSRISSSVLGLLLLGTSASSASVLAWQNSVKADGDALHLWSFDGADDTARQADGKGSNNLIKQGTGTLTYSAGYDATSNAVTTVRAGSTAFSTSATIPMPTSISYEGIISPTDFGASGTGYLFASKGTTSGSSPRNYFAVQDANQSFYNIGGTSFTNQTSLGTTVDNRWYYMAATLVYDPAGTGTVTVNTWYADLSAANPVLMTATNTFTSTGTFAINSRYGVGMLNNAGTFEQAFNGKIDELAVYNVAKDASFFESQFAIIPEPSSLSLLGIAGLCLLRRKRSA